MLVVEVFYKNQWLQQNWFLDFQFEVAVAATRHAAASFQTEARIRRYDANEPTIEPTIEYEIDPHALPADWRSEGF